MKRIYSFKDLKPNTWFVCPNSAWFAIYHGNNRSTAFKGSRPWEKDECYVYTPDRSDHSSLADLVYYKDIEDLLNSVETYDEFIILLNLQYSNL